METQTGTSPLTPPSSTGEAFSLTDKAMARIAKLLAGEPAGTYFRISVLGGGCSGFQYKFDFDNTSSAATDTIIEKNGAIVLLDDISLDLLKGSVLDYVETLGSAGFEIKNPNATARCGCGNSFSV